MSIYDDLLQAGATEEIKKESAWAVSFWVMRFNDYSNPENHTLFYDNDNKETVKKVISRWNFPPEMPLVTDIETHKMIVEEVRKTHEKENVELSQ